MGYLTVQVRYRDGKAGKHIPGELIIHKRHLERKTHPTNLHSTPVAVDNQLDNGLKNSALLHEVFSLIFWGLLLRGSPQRSLVQPEG